MKKYSTNEGMPRDQALQLIQTAEPEKMMKAFVSLAHHDEDPNWVVGKLLPFVEHANATIRAAALHCLYLISRNRGVLPTSQAYAVAKQHLTAGDSETREAAENLLSEVVKAATSSGLVPLDALSRSLERGEEWQKLATIAALFRHDEPRDAVQALGRKVMQQPEDIVRAWALRECREFLITDENTLDMRYANELIKLAEQRATPYLQSAIVEFREWIELTQAALNAENQPRKKG